MFARLAPAFGRLPSDPGYDFLTNVEEFGLRSFVQASEKYIQIAPRVVAWIALQFPVAQQAAVLQIIAVVVLALLGTLISWAIETQTQSRLLGGLLALVFLTIPAASESTLGNAGSLKWPLLAALGIVAVCPQFFMKFVRFTAFFTLFVAISSPMVLVALLPIIWFAGTNRTIVRSLAPILFAGVLGLGTQFVAWLLKNRQIKIYGDSIQQTPWPGMGVFWYLVWIGPLVAALSAIVALRVVLRRTSWKGVDLQPAIMWLAMMSIILSVLVHLSAGIKDSAAVATQTFAWSAVVLFTLPLLSTRDSNRFMRALGGLSLAFITLFSLKWFGASQYLSGGPTWKSEVEQAKRDCVVSTEGQAKLQLNLAVVELPCSKLR